MGLKDIAYNFVKDKKVFESALDYRDFIISKKRLTTLLKNGKDIDSILDITDEYRGRGHYKRINMAQKRMEIKSLATTMESIDPKIVVEIGTKNGGTLFTWCRYSNAAKIISIDLQGGIHGGGYDSQRRKFYKFFLEDQPNRKMFLMQKDSHKEETLLELKEILNNSPIDFLFIDGDHTLDGVTKDFEMYSPLVRKGGIIAFHDIVPNKTTHKDAATIDVPVFWKKIKPNYPYEEFIDINGPSNMGIGVLFM